ncbi:hypothetical protein KIW84_076330 [Lathyrus oleraceus]|uniref:Putative plant transposon protein domain-containing protein n=1 Tax=Pisum sativum TaxID=3888 RepID=A0A9D4VWG4_PEA|nr:hypothetical protein KIW84_076330 [Pisum sativum]
MRGTSSRELVPFDPQIERTARKNKRRRSKQKKLTKQKMKESTSVLSTTPITETMAEKTVNGMNPKRDVTKKKQKTTGAGTSRGKNPLIRQNFSDQSNKIGIRNELGDPSARFAFSFSTKVVGRTIQFHRDAINEFFGNPLVLQEGPMCRYQESINKVPNVEEISKKIILDEREVERNPFGATIRYRREDLIPEAQVLLLFILYNIRPRSHTSTFIMDTAQLLYLIMSGKRIDVAQIIANDMGNVAESGKEFGIGTISTCPLVFIGLIMGLLIALHIQPRGKPDAGHHFMTPGEFQTHIAWPGDKPFYQGEAAGHRDENENDEEYAEAEMENEEGTSGGSKTKFDDDTVSDDDEEIGGE